jgi:hypothetical protein
MITPRTHRKKGEEVERWAISKKHEIAKKILPLDH